MNGPTLHLIGGLAAVALLSVGASAPAAEVSRHRGDAVRLAEATLIVEVNATDGDAGLQVFLDGDPWRSMRVMGPNGRTILGVDTNGRLRGYGPS